MKRILINPLAIAVMFVGTIVLGGWLLPPSFMNPDYAREIGSSLERAAMTSEMHSGDLAFKRSHSNRRGFYLVYSTTSIGKAASDAAVYAGASGGVVVEPDRVASPVQAWSFDLSSFGIHIGEIPVGAVAYLVMTPPATIAEVGGPCDLTANAHIATTSDAVPVICANDRLKWNSAQPVKQGTSR